LFLGEFGLAHVLWLSFVIFIRLIFLASVAIISSFEIVILAFRALPSTFWEVEEESILFGVVVINFFGSYSGLSWHEDSTLWVKAWSIDGFSFDWSGILVLVALWSLAKDWWISFSWAFVSWRAVKTSGLATVIIWVRGAVVVISSEVEVLMRHKLLRSWLSFSMWVNGRVTIDNVQQVGTNSSVLSSWAKVSVAAYIAVFLNEILIEFWVKFLIFFGRLIFIV
jgi:hypothetical protein